jgi:hypothetical protein
MYANYRDINSVEVFQERKKQRSDTNEIGKGSDIEKQLDDLRANLELKKNFLTWLVDFSVCIDAKYFYV